MNEPQYTAHYTAGTTVNTVTIVRDDPRLVVACLVVDDEADARELASEVGSKFSTEPLHSPALR